MAGNSRAKRVLWQVGHPAHHKVWVEAVSWEQATVAAAAAWGAPWGKVAAECYLVQKKTALGGVCSSCGRFYHSPGEILCDACRKIQETENARDQAHARAYYMRKACGGKGR